MRWWYTGEIDADRPLDRKDKSERERFNALVDRAGSCWLWLGSVNRTGYGYFSRNGRSMLAHRFAYEQFVGPIPEGAQVDHDCHNRDRSCRGGWSCLHRRCVNPAHLRLATQSENLRSGRCGDRVRERSEATTHCPKGHLKESKGYCPECRRAGQRAKSLKSQGLRDPRRMSDEVVERVRALLAQGKTQAQISADVGISQASVSRIRNGGSWFAPK